MVTANGKMTNSQARHLFCRASASDASRTLSLTRGRASWRDHRAGARANPGCGEDAAPGAYSIPAESDYARRFQGVMRMQITQVASVSSGRMFSAGAAHLLIGLV